ncbi:uncharacterized protein UDID_19000 [Ustilago sp. UG-2017a]|nr:uncharacterized protein UDID_19000 [Ustilago sp. UG-2017a]
MDKSAFFKGCASSSFTFHSALHPIRFASVEDTSEFAGFIRDADRAKLVKAYAAYSRADSDMNSAGEILDSPKAARRTKDDMAMAQELVPIAITNSNTSGSSIAACFKLWTTTFERRTIKQQATFELISTETAHVRDLQIIVEAFFSSTQNMLSEKASTIIFANIQNALSTLESCFEERTDGFLHRTDAISRATKTSRCETDSLEKPCSLPAYGSRSSIAQNAVGDRVDEKLSQCPAQQCCVTRRAW